MIYTRAQKLVNPAERHKLLYEAGLICQAPPPLNFLHAAKLFYEGQHWKRAAECYLQVQLSGNAGMCFEKCNEFARATNAYYCAGLAKEFASI